MINDIISFTIDGKAVAKARARVTRNGAYTPAKTKAFEQHTALQAKTAMAGKNIIDGAVKAHFIFYLPVPTSFSKKVKKECLNGFRRPTKKPDLDNYTKAVLDACNGIVYKDDSAVVCMRLEKYYSLTPKTLVSFKKIAEAVK